MLKGIQYTLKYTIIKGKKKENHTGNFYLDGTNLLDTIKNVYNLIQYRNYRNYNLGVYTRRDNRKQLKKIQDFNEVIAQLNEYNNDQTTKIRTGELYFDIGGITICKMKDEENGGKGDGFYMETDKYKGGLSYAELLHELGAEIPNINNNEVSKQIASDLRSMMSGSNPTHYPTPEQKEVLALLAAVMFIAEPARNRRYFPSHLMMLDLIEKGATYGKDGTKYYTWDKVLWHPEAESSTDPPKKQYGSSYKVIMDKGHRQVSIKGIEEIMQKRDLHRTGGKLPAGSTGTAKIELVSIIDPQVYYPQAKEVTICARWLVEKNDKLAFYRDQKEINSRENPMRSDFQYRDNNNITKFKTDEIDSLLNMRVSTLDFLLA